jgi:sugar phosphate isomerase/epimerase
VDDRITQRDVAKIILIAAAIGAAGVAGAEGARWAKKRLDKKDPAKWWKTKAAPILMHVGFESSRRLASWFGSRVVTMDQLKPGMSPKKWATAVDRIRTVCEDL